LGHPEVEHILPIQLPEKNKEMFLFDLQIVGYWVSKNATKIAEIATFLSKYLHHNIHNIWTTKKGRVITQKIKKPRPFNLGFHLLSPESL